MRVKLPPYDGKEFCLICGAYAFGEHHVYEGKNRQESEKWNCKFPICADCHTAAPYALHRDNESLVFYKQLYQEKLEDAGWTREEFIQTFGRNYL